MVSRTGVSLEISTPGTEHCPSRTSPFLATLLGRPHAPVQTVMNKHRSCTGMLRMGKTNIPYVTTGSECIATEYTVTSSLRTCRRGRNTFTLSVTNTVMTEDSSRLIKHKTDRIPHTIAPTTSMIAPLARTKGTSEIKKLVAPKKDLTSRNKISHGPFNRLGSTPKGDASCTKTRSTNTVGRRLGSLPGSLKNTSSTGTTTTRNYSIPSLH